MIASATYSAQPFGTVVVVAGAAVVVGTMLVRVMVCCPVVFGRLSDGLLAYQRNVKHAKPLTTHAPNLIAK